MKTEKTKLRRIPRRGHHDRETIISILDKEFVCHIGFVHEGYPVVIPTLYGRDGEFLYVHGSMASRMMKDLSGGLPLSITVTRVNGLVLARSSFHHSMNYESVVLFGHATEVTDKAEKIHGFKAVSDHIIADRWEEVRPILDNEIKATMLLKIPIEEASAKIRAEGIKDDKADYELDIWGRHHPGSSGLGGSGPRRKSQSRNTGFSISRPIFEKKKRMSLFKEDFVLENQRLRLMPSSLSDLEHLYQIADQRIWAHSSTSIRNRQDMFRYLEKAGLDRQNEVRQELTVIDKLTGAYCGCSSFENISIPHRRLEIGWTWLGLQFQGKGINKIAKYLMLAYVFEQLEFERVEFRVRGTNAQSQRALEKIGAVREGRLRSYFEAEGQRHDFIYFSILREEWPQLKAGIFAAVSHPE